jgi:nucleoside triphosphate pyrophosphatase
VSAPPAPPLLLASRSPQRRAILEQLAIPFEAVIPQYEEELTGAGPVEEVTSRAQGKARSLAGLADDRPVLGVDTEVVLDGRVYGKPGDEAEAETMLDELSGKTHEVVSGLCLLTPGWEELRHEITRVTFRSLTPRELGLYVASEEWRERAGGYAIQGLGAALVERIEGDYLNVVGLPGALLVNLLAEHFPGVYGFG